MDERVFSYSQGVVYAAPTFDSSRGPVYIPHGSIPSVETLASRIGGNGICNEEPVTNYGFVPVYPNDEAITGVSSTVYPLPITIGVPVQVAPPPPPGPSGVVVGNLEWRQLPETMGWTWAQVASVCDSTTGVCNGSLGSQDFTGWTWASAQEVGTLFNALTPHPGDLSTYGEIGSSWAPEFLSNFNPTSSGRAAGLTRTTFNSSGGPSVQSYLAFVSDNLDPTLYDNVGFTNATLTGLYDRTGIWLYRPYAP